MGLYTHLLTFIIIFCFSKQSFSFPESIDSQARFINKENSAFSLSNLNYSFHFEGSLSVTRDQLLKFWNLHIPYIEAGISYPFSKSQNFKAELDLSYQKGHWIYSVDHLFIEKHFVFPLSMSWGYLPYPVSFVIETENLFSKKTLVHKSLFVEADRALGGLWQGVFNPSIYWKISLQSPFLKRETDLAYKRSLPIAWTASLFYKKDQKTFFTSYLKQDLFLEGQMQSIGAGSDVSYNLFGFRGELWNIKKQQPNEYLWTYYLFPYLKWQKFFLGFFIGRVSGYLKTDSYFIEEYILKGEVHWTKHLYMTIEWLQEQDSIFKQQEWVISLKTKF